MGRVVYQIPLTWVRWNHWKLRPRQKLKMKTHFQTQILSSLPLMRNIQNLWLRKSKWKLNKPTVIRGFLYYVPNLLLHFKFILQGTNKTIHSTFWMRTVQVLPFLAKHKYWCNISCLLLFLVLFHTFHVLSIRFNVSSASVMNITLSANGYLRI